MSFAQFVYTFWAWMPTDFVIAACVLTLVALICFVCHVLRMVFDALPIL